MLASKKEEKEEKEAPRGQKRNADELQGTQLVRGISGPYVELEKLLRRRISEGSNLPPPAQPFYKITPKQRDTKLAEFEEYIARRSEEINNGSDDDDFMAQEITIQEPQAVASAAGPQKICRFYWIGRGNPIHDGHILAMIQMLEKVRQSREEGCDARGLILLGSGPKNGYPMDNPITFELKADIIREKLADYQEGVDYVIQEMNSPASDVSTFVKNGLQGNLDELDIDVTHIGGDKDGGGDLKKFKFMGPAITKSVSSEYSGANLKHSSFGVASAQNETGDSMSATGSRLDTNDSFKTAFNENPESDFETLLREGYKIWPEKYKTFYGEVNGPRVYRGIIEAIPGDTIKDRIDNIERYEYSKSGGSIRNKRNKSNKRNKNKKGNKTKKRSNLKKRRTQRKKRRTTRRK